MSLTHCARLGVRVRVRVRVSVSARVSPRIRESWRLHKEDQE